MNQMSFGWDETIRPLRYTPSPDGNRCKRPREADPVPFPGSTSPRRFAVKKPRQSASRHARAVPVRRRIEGLNHQQLFALVESLCEHNPQVHSQIAKLAPEITVESAISSLEQYLGRIEAAVPFGAARDAELGDYAYLRVQPHLHDFFVALADYTTALLPPNQESPHRTLEFLDAATDLVHRIPSWHTDTNNFLKNSAYGELSSAWQACLDALAESNTLVRLDTDARLAYHASKSHGKMVVQAPGSGPVLSIAPMQSVVA